MAESRTQGKGLDQQSAPQGGGSGEPATDNSTVLSTRAKILGEPEDVLAIGALVGRYMVVERLGAGAMGVVYAAYDPQLDRKIALKLLRPRHGDVDQVRRQERLAREAKAIARLSHPNIVGIFDVGVHQEKVFLAMEYLGGGTLKRWLAAEKRPWQQVAKIFIDVGRGLVAAHAEGLIHRDFKPDNVLLDKNGVAKVVDFGLVRLATGSVDGLSTERDDLSSSSDGEQSGPGAVALTNTGALMGTPAYMAPEQFLGSAVDAATDQFSFCASLYQALYGERPFPGDTVVKLADSVTHGRVRPAPETSAVPGWLRRVILRGLSVDPAQRYPGMSELLHALGQDPVARRRRRVGIAAVVLAVAALVFGLQRRSEHRRAELQRLVTARLADSARFIEEARRSASEIKAGRDQAFGLFDRRDLAAGEEVWKRSLARLPELSKQQSLAVRALEAVVAIDPDRADIKRTLAAWTCEQAAQWARLGIEGELLARYAKNLPGAATCAAGGDGETTLSVRSNVRAPLVLERFDFDDAGLAVLSGSRRLDPGALDRLRIAPGSIRLTIDLPGPSDVHVPLLVRRNEARTVDLVVPAAIPKGFKFVPAGAFFFGDDDETLRTGFLGTVPLHEVHTGAYLIAEREVTYGDWIAFLDEQPPAVRRVLAPKVASAGFKGSLELREVPGGWQLRIGVADQMMTARNGEVLTYPARERNRSVDWHQLPITGVSLDQIDHYLRWYRDKRGVSARLCDEREWERAARGADKRVFPHGMNLAPRDANFDETYGRNPLAQGPDPVGSYPQSRSPFGLDDMTGNAMELTRSALEEGVVVRGGAFYFGAASCRVTNRYPVTRDFQDRTVGFRLCADQGGSQ